MRLHFDTHLFGSPAAIKFQPNSDTTLWLSAEQEHRADVIWHLRDGPMARAVHDAIKRVLDIRAAPPANIETSRPLSDVLGSPVFDHLTVKMGWSVEDGGAALVALDIVDAKGAHQDVPAWLWEHVRDVYHHEAEEVAEPLRWPVSRAESPEEIIDRGIAAIAGEVAATRRAADGVAADVSRLREAAE